MIGYVVYKPDMRIRRAALDQARQAMMAAGQWTPSQSMGRRWPIGCVALEITQRCNLDCSACYLSEHSQNVRDVPLDEIYRRIDMIRARYGPGTGVQVTGGDPTLRNRDELIAVVRRIRERGMLPALVTNGIKATRGLLSALVDVGLVDVAFHVDMTQRRPGYRSEAELNEVRRAYIERTQGLPLSVFFNTTVFDGNFEQIPEIVAFFVRYSDVVRLASFQPQAETGRGARSRRSAALNVRSLIAQIEKGAGTSISFDTAHIGHSACNRYAMTFVANGHVYDVLDNKDLYDLLVARTASTHFDRQSRSRAVRAFIRCLFRNPDIIIRGAAWLARKMWTMRKDLLAARGRVNKLSFFVHNFMDACNLDRGRIAACVFKVATQTGPVSMCSYNAKRDAFILEPALPPAAGEQDVERHFNPEGGSVLARPSNLFHAGPKSLPGR